MYGSNCRLLLYVQLQRNNYEDEPLQRDKSNCQICDKEKKSSKKLFCRSCGEVKQ